MAKPRRTHSAEFKREAVRLTQEPGRTLKEVAANLGLDRSMLWRWRMELEQHGATAFPGTGASNAPDAEVRQLRKELLRTQQERDILKKALAFFANERS